MLCPRCSLPMHQFAMACARCGEATPRAVVKTFQSKPGGAGPRSNPSVKREVRIDRRTEGVRVLDVPWSPSGAKPRAAATPHWERGTPVRTPHLIPNVIPTAPQAAPPSIVFEAPTDPLWIQEPQEETAPPPIPQEAPVPFASRWRRAAGWLVDSAVIGAVATIAVLTGLTAFGWEAALPQLSRGFDEVLDGVVIGRNLWVFCLLLLIVTTFVYTTISHTLMGRTLGQQLLGLRLETRDGEHPSMSDCAWRSGLAIVALMLGGLSAAWALFDAQGLALHDRLVGTRVVRDPPPPAPPEAEQAVDVDLTTPSEPPTE